MTVSRIVQKFTENVSGAAGPDQPRPVAPAIMQAVCVAHHAAPFPFTTTGHPDAEALYRHYQAFEAALGTIAPQIVAELDASGDLWRDHFAACQRLASLLHMGPHPFPLDNTPRDLIHALASTPYVVRTDGTLGLCDVTFALKLRWFTKARSRT